MAAMSLPRLTSAGLLRATCTCTTQKSAARTVARYRPLSTSTRILAVDTDIKGKGKSTSKIQVLPFDILPTNALNKSRAHLTISLAAKNLSKLRVAWEMFLNIFGFPNAIPDIEVIRWKPIYLPYWQMDLSSELSARLNGEEQVLELIGSDIPFPGTDVQPFASHNLTSPSRDSLSSSLQSFDQSKHITVFKKEDMPTEEEEVQTVLPIAFNRTPKDLPEILRQVLSGIRNDDVRFTGQTKTTLFAAYPIYMPYYLINFKNKKAESTNDEITGLLFGGAGLSLTTPPFAFWSPTEAAWFPQVPTNAHLQLQAFRRSRTNNNQTEMSEDSEQGGSSSSFHSFSPRAAAEEAARSGNIDHGPPGSRSHNAMKFLEFRKLAEKAGELVKDSFYKIMLRTATEGTEEKEKWKPNATVEEVERKMQGIPNFMSFSDNAGKNQEYINARSEVRKAIETVGQAKNMPRIPEGQKAKVLAIQPKARFGISFKTLDAAGLADIKKQAIKSAQKKLLEAETAAKNCKPSWLVDMEKGQA